MTPDELKTAREMCERVPQPQDWELILAARTTLPAALDFIEELLSDLFYSGAAKVRDGDGCMAGWWDSCALSHVRDAGDCLVAIGKLEKHPGGTGRRWFYRPIEKEKSRG